MPEDELDGGGISPAPKAEFLLALRALASGAIPASNQIHYKTMI